MRCCIVLLTLGGWLSLAPVGWTQSPLVEKKPVDPAGKPETLEQLLVEALRNNPDVRVAETKLREAEAQAQRTRLKVVADITTLRADIEAARAIYKEAEERLKTTQVLFTKGGATVEDLRAAVLARDKYYQELAAKEARLPYLLGRAPGGTTSVIDDLLHKKWVDSGKGAVPVDEAFLHRVMLDMVGRLPTPEETQKFLKMLEKGQNRPGERVLGPVQVAGTAFAPNTQFHKLHPGLVDKLGKALNGTMRLDVGNVPAQDALELCREKLLPGCLHLRVKGLKKEGIDLKFKDPLPVAAILQYLEDELEIVFVLRDYGVVAVTTAERLPPGALRVLDFWRHLKASETTEKK